MSTTHEAMTVFADIIAHTPVEYPLSDNPTSVLNESASPKDTPHTPETSQCELIGQCPYCGRINAEPPAPHNVYQRADGVTQVAHLGQIIPGYLPGSTSRTCEACAAAVFSAWLSSVREAVHVHA